MNPNKDQSSDQSGVGEEGCMQYCFSCNTPFDIKRDGCPFCWEEENIGSCTIKILSVERYD